MGLMEQYGRRRTAEMGSLARAFRVAAAQEDVIAKEYAVPPDPDLAGNAAESQGFEDEEWWSS